VIPKTNHGNEIGALFASYARQCRFDDVDRQPLGQAECRLSAVPLVQGHADDRRRQAVAQFASQVRPRGCQLPAKHRLGPLDNLLHEQTHAFVIVGVQRRLEGLRRQPRGDPDGRFPALLLKGFIEAPPAGSAAEGRFVREGAEGRLVALLDVLADDRQAPGPACRAQQLRKADVFLDLGGTRSMPDHMGRRIELLRRMQRGKHFAHVGRR
jgi:hypothetical protein